MRLAWHGNQTDGGDGLGNFPEKTKTVTNPVKNEKKIKNYPQCESRSIIEFLNSDRRDLRPTRMKESLDRSELRRMQREQERERRRIRDRQRRQSMTVEQRERHLARRRRNYQLRRLRAENAKVDFQSNQISNEHEHEADAAAAVESDMSTEPLQSLDAVACKASHLTTKRLRLSHVRRLARSVVSRLGGEVLAHHHRHHHHILGEADDANKTSCFQIGDFDSGRLPNGLRLNRVKRLARAINTASKEASVNGHQVTEKNTMEQNHSLEERQWISNDNSNLDKLSLPDVKLKDLTWTDKHPSWANVES